MARSSRLFIRPQNTQNTNRIHSAISVDIKKEICEYMLANLNTNQTSVASFFNTKYVGSSRLFIRPQNTQNTNRIHSAISVDIKKEICEYMLANLNTNQTSVASFFNTKYVGLNINRTTIIMQIWTSQAVAVGLPISDAILQQKGLEFAKLLNIENQLKCTNG
ncbi:hypothetical protein Glove_668g40 [Diversispora epigaea]|uniref:Uncharacterized protein n=1 Tax=Diversispora epigaea TaxID=1348612 RepID=A0A397G7Q5_9GLOM|nr:hypothetical protein Glove_668g40 [Diversispora epigaea]